MSKVFGFDSSINAFVEYEINVKEAKGTLKKNAEKMKDDAISIATSKGLNKTGKGVEGIDTKDIPIGAQVGWKARPNLHLYFHEVGYHAHGRKQRIPRESKGKRERIYKKGTRYISPRPHMLPSFEKNKDSFYSEMKKTLYRRSK